MKFNTACAPATEGLVKVAGLGEHLTGIGDTGNVPILNSLVKAGGIFEPTVPT